MKFARTLPLVAVVALFVSTAHAYVIPPALESQFRELRKLPDQKARVGAFDHLVADLGSIQFDSLEDSLAASELTAPVIQLLRQRSAGVIGGAEFLRRGSVSIAGGYSLGLSGQKGQYEMLSERGELIAWPEAYDQFEIDWKRIKNHTEIFLTRITDSGLPIVFFVPARVLTHPKAGVTKREFEWLLAHPDRLAKMLFVFGGYGFVTPSREQLRMDAGMSEDEFRALVTRALGLPKASRWEW